MCGRFTLVTRREDLASRLGIPLDALRGTAVEANELISRIHHRMPVILPQGVRDPWLDPTNDDVDALLALLKPHLPEETEMFPVTRRVNSPRNADEGCLVPAEGDA